MVFCKIHLSTDPTPSSLLGFLGPNFLNNYCELHFDQPEFEILQFDWSYACGLQFNSNLSGQKPLHIVS